MVLQARSRDGICRRKHLVRSDEKKTWIGRFLHVKENLSGDRVNEEVEVTGDAFQVVHRHPNILQDGVVHILRVETLEVVLEQLELKQTSCDQGCL